jgi:hypothetical protein
MGPVSDQRPVVRCGVVLTDQFSAELYDRLQAGKFAETGPDYPFKRGYNAAIDFAIKQLRLTCDEPIEDEQKING